MNLVDAIKSGRPFRRKNTWGDTPWRNAKDGAFIADELLADDWEIQEPTVTISRSQFWEAVEQIFGFKVESWGGIGSVIRYSGKSPPQTHQIHQLARKLGLEPSHDGDGDAD